VAHLSYIYRKLHCIDTMKFNSIPAEKLESIVRDLDVETTLGTSQVCSSKGFY